MPHRMLFALSVLLTCVILRSECGRIVGEGATGLNVVGSLSPIHDALLAFDPRMQSLVLPLSSPNYVVSPPRVYVADPEVIRKLSAPASTTTPPPRAPSSATPEVRARPFAAPRPFAVANPAFGARRASSPAASEANFPSSQSSSFTPAQDGDAADAGETVRRIQAYSKPVTIPASGRAHFSTMNADGSYHFGYDTGSGQHQSYREEKRYPDGRIEGKYGYVDPEGVLRVVEYVADQRGYRSRLTTHNLSSGSSLSFIGPIPPPLLARARSAASAGR